MESHLQISHRFSDDADGLNLGRGRCLHQREMSRLADYAIMLRSSAMGVVRIRRGNRDGNARHQEQQGE